MRRRNFLSLLIAATGFLAASPSHAQAPFAERQKNAPRVRAARARIGEEVKAMFEAKGIRYPAASLLLRSFKDEAELELWASNTPTGRMTLIKTFPICANSGKLGPKRQAGDLQVPEGFYEVTHHNAWSNFHLSVKINYPNKADRIVGKRVHGGKLGWNICIHGNCVTIGCIPIQDEPMEELYLAMLDTRIEHERTTYVHLYPARLDDDGFERLLAIYTDAPELTAFWRNIKEGYDAFEATHRLPRISVEADGRYRVRARR